MTNASKPPYKHTQTEDNNFASQEKIIFHYLRSRLATNAMISRATGIPQKNICRRKRDLEKAGKLWCVEERICKVTGHKAMYLTTNPTLAKQDQ